MSFREDLILFVFKKIIVGNLKLPTIEYLNSRSQTEYYQNNI